MTQLSTSGAGILIGVLLLYVGALIVVGRIAGRNVDDSGDYLLAGRSVPMMLSVLALLATWFGSSAILGTTRMTYELGLRGTVLEPFACAATLILTGCFFAKPLWKLQVSTVADLFREKMGRSAEWISCAIQVPTFFCWIGAQYLSIGALLEAYLGLPAWIGMLLSSGVVLAILWSGGMWAVTWTNSLMIALSIASVVFLFWSTATRVGDGSVLNGITSVIEHTPSDQLSFVPDMSLPAVLSVLGVFLTGLLGNIPGQDLQQRVLSARDPWVARWSCIVSGIIYALLGLIPIYVGLAAKWKLQDGITPEDIAGDRILPIAASAFLSEPLVILLVVGLLSVNLAVAASSTLSQTTILSSNILAPWWQTQKTTPGLDRVCVLIVTAGSLAAAFSGESVMGLLEVSLAIVMVSLFVPMCVCLFGTPSSPWVGVASMVAGLLVWGLHGFVAAWPQVPWLVGYRAIPPEIQGLGASFLAAVVTERVFRRKDR